VRAFQVSLRFSAYDSHPLVFRPPFLHSLTISELSVGTQPFVIRDVAISRTKLVEQLPSRVSFPPSSSSGSSDVAMDQPLSSNDDEIAAVDNEVVLLDIDVVFNGLSDRLVFRGAVDSICADAVVDSIRFHGRVRVLLRGLCGRWPCFTQAEAALLGEPYVDFNLSVFALNLMHFPGLHSFIESFLKKTVFSSMTWPEKYSLNLLKKPIQPPTLISSERVENPVPLQQAVTSIFLEAAVSQLHRILPSVHLFEHGVTELQPRLSTPPPLDLDISFSDTAERKEEFTSPATEHSTPIQLPCEPLAPVSSMEQQLHSPPRRSTDL